MKETGNCHLKKPVFNQKKRKKRKKKKLNRAGITAANVI